MAKPEPQDPKSERFNAYPWWALRIWSGMRPGAFFSLLGRHGYRISPQRWAMAAIIGQMTPWNSAMYGLSQLFYGRRIRETTIDQPPVFIIGHWRSGTTHLHELMTRDPQFGYATTYECFVPWHFVASEWLLARMLGVLLPKKRPMDNMATGMRRPQEDEFGLMAMGAPTCYQHLAFPNDSVDHLDTLNMLEVSDQDRRRMIQAITWFYRALTLKQKKRLLLKSPPHTGRIRFLRKLFPGAKFVHISRTPYEVFPSMQRCWRALYDAQGLQVRTDYGPDFDQFVHTSYQALYREYDAQSAELPEGDYCEVRYETLAADPLEVVRSIYQDLRLEGYDEMRPALETYIASQKNYQPNRLTLAPEVKAAVDDRWGWYFERFGYEKA